MKALALIGLMALAATQLPAEAETDQELICGLRAYPVAKVVWSKGSNYLIEQPNGTTRYVERCVLKASA